MRIRTTGTVYRRDQFLFHICAFENGLPGAIVLQIVAYNCTGV
jgi:hypothetical protein